MLHTNTLNLPPSTLVDEAAAAVGLGGEKPLSVKTLQAWRLYRRGPRYLKIGRSVRYRVGDLRDWLESRERTCTGDDAKAAA